MFTHLRKQCRTPSKRISLSRVSGFQSRAIHSWRTIVGNFSTLGVLPHALHVLISTRHLRRRWKKRCSRIRFLNLIINLLTFSYIQTCAEFTLEEKRVLVWSQKVDDRRVTVLKFRRMVKGCALLQNDLRPTLPAKAAAQRKLSRSASAGSPQASSWTCL